MESLKLFTQHIKQRKKPLALLFLLGLGGSATDLTTPLIGKAFIDAVVERADYSLVPLIALALVVLAVTNVTIGFATRLLHAKLSAGVLVEIRQRLFRHCLHARLAHLERFRHGDLLSRFGSDIPKIQALLVDGLLGVLHNSIFLVLCAVILVWLSPVLALWSYLGLTLALVVTTAFDNPIEHGTRGIREKMADLSHFLAERLGALREIRYHGAQAQETGTFGRLNKQLVQRVMRFQLTESAASGLPGLVLSLSLAWIYLLGGGQLQSGAISLGTFVAFVLYQGRLYGPAVGLLGFIKTLQQVRVSLERVAEVLAEAESSEQPEYRKMSGRDAIHLENVSFAYDGKPVLQNLNLLVNRGEKVALFGLSGVGKSTLIQLVFGLRKVRTGTVRIGTDGQKPPALGYAGSEPFLLHASIRDNLCYGNPEAGSKAQRSAAEKAEALPFILALPAGFDTLIGHRGHRLSDGQRQRLGLARLFLAAPQIMVLDEAFSAVDPDTENRVRANLFSAFSTRTILIISHRLGGLEQFDRLLLMTNGQLEQISKKDLLAYFASHAPLQGHAGKSRQATGPCPNYASAS